MFVSKGAFWILVAHNNLKRQNPRACNCYIDGTMRTTKTAICLQTIKDQFASPVWFDYEYDLSLYQVYDSPTNQPLDLKS